METEILLRGLFFGLAIAAPVGPIGILCIRRTLVHGHVHGFASGLGAATADAVYGCLAGFGLAFVSTLILNLALWPQVIGGLFLCYLGGQPFYRTLWKRRHWVRDACLPHLPRRLA